MLELVIILGKQEHLLLKVLLGSGATALGSVISCFIEFKLTHYLARRSFAAKL
jgi:hypothetical protein